LLESDVKGQGDDLKGGDQKMSESAEVFEAVILKEPFGNEIEVTSPGAWVISCASDNAAFGTGCALH
jgi:hypothetical protein